MMFGLLVTANHLLKNRQLYCVANLKKHYNWKL